MSEAEQRRNRISERIAASQARLDRNDHGVPTVPHLGQLPDASPPETYRGLAGEHPWLAVAAGLGLGVLAGSLLPKGLGGKAGRRLLGAAAAAAELGFALSKQARDKAEGGARDGLALIDDSTAPLRQRATRSARSARSTGVRLAGEAIKLAARLRK